VSRSKPDRPLCAGEAKERLERELIVDCLESVQARPLSTAGAAGALLVFSLDILARVIRNHGPSRTNDT
jgi:hypothetical protein